MNMPSDVASLEWVSIHTEDDLPKKPGKESYEYVECLIFHDGEVKYRPWNCEHRCWDDEEHDDFFCEAHAPSHYAVLTYREATRLVEEDLLCHIPHPKQD